MPFGLGRPVRSTLTLLILVPHAPLPLEPAPRAYTSLRASNRPCGSLPCPARLHVPHLHVPVRPPPPFPLARPLPALKDRGHAEGAASAVDTTPPSGGFFGWILAQRASILAGDYGRRCPEGMLGVASALPGTRALAA